MVQERCLLTLLSTAGVKREEKRTTKPPSKVGEGKTSAGGPLSKALGKPSGSTAGKRKKVEPADHEPVKHERVTAVVSTKSAAPAEPRKRTRRGVGNLPV